MFRRGLDRLKVISGLTGALCGVLAVTGALAGPMNVARPASAEAPIARVTFWGHPYPYGYAYVHHESGCLERRRIQTYHGWVWKKVWICPDRLVTK